MITNLQILMFAKGVKYYRDLKQLQDDVNSFSQHITLLYYIVILLYYAESPHLVFQEYILMLIGHTCFLIVHTFFWILAANYNKTVTIPDINTTKVIFNKFLKLIRFTFNNNLFVGQSGDNRMDL